MRLARYIGLALLVVATLTSPAVADDDDIIVKKMWFGERRGKLVTTTAFTELLDERAYSRLDSGFATTIVARLYVYRKGRELPVGYVISSFRIVYDLWRESYTVRVDGPTGRTTRHYKKRADALKALTELRQFPIADLADVRRGPHHYMALVVELNPVSKELQAEMRRWLTRPAGSASIDRSSSFFGSFVSVFVNPRVPEADRVRKFRSQPFYRPKK